MKPLPWSHSSLEKFRNCPHQYAEVKVYKTVEDSKGDAAIWGDWVHTQIEDHYKQRPTPEWHPNMLPYVPQVERALEWAGLGEGKRYVELELGISTKLQPCTMQAPDVWGRGIVDFLVLHPDTGHGKAIDWKTGKVKPDSKQMKRFALFIFYNFPRIVTLDTSFEWLQHGEHTRASFSLTDVQDIWRELMPELTQYQNAFKTEEFPKKQSGLCNGWCPVEHCQHWKPKR